MIDFVEVEHVALGLGAVAGGIYGVMRLKDRLNAPIAALEKAEVDRRIRDVQIDMLISNLREDVDNLKKGNTP